MLGEPKNMDGNGGLTLTVLGCGTMGIAILSGILTSLRESNKFVTAPNHTSSTGLSTPNSEDLPPRLPTRFIACVQRPESVCRIQKELAPYMSSITILQDENAKGVQEADVILLACKPQLVKPLLLADGMREAFRDKLLISICAGVTLEQLDEYLGDLSQEVTSQTGGEVKTPCRIIRAMPNTASFIRQSMTVISTPHKPLPPHLALLTHWIFTRIGKVVHLPPTAMDVCTALCGSGPAFMALILESIADGAVAMGLPRAEAQLMSAQVMKGAADLVLNGEHPALLRDKVSTPGGCTIGGLLVLEEGRVRGTMARAVREATVVASELGKGSKGVNGTRF